MEKCDICKKNEVEFEIDGWEKGGENLWNYRVCKECYGKIKQIIINLKSK